MHRLTLVAASKLRTEQVKTGWQKQLHQHAVTSEWMPSPVLTEGEIDFTDALMKEESALFPYNGMGNWHGVTELAPEKMLNSLIWAAI